MRPCTEKRLSLPYFYGQDKFKLLITVEGFVDNPKITVKKMIMQKETLMSKTNLTINLQVNEEV